MQISTIENNETIETFKPTEKNINEVLEYIKNIILQDDFNKKDNYSKWLNLKNQEAISLLKNENGEIIIFTTVAKNPISENCIRILSKYYITPKFRKIVEPLTNRTLNLIKSQIKFVKKTLGEPDHFIITREHPGLRYMRREYEKLTNKITTKRWNYTNELRLVCPYPESKGCWQYVIYTGNPVTFPLTDRISKEEWKLKK